MKARNVLTIALLLFVAASVIYLIRGQDNSTVIGEKAVSANDRMVVAYYFHRTARCRTCRAIEANAHDVLTTSFPGELESGILEIPATSTSPRSTRYSRAHWFSCRWWGGNRESGPTWKVCGRWSMTRKNLILT